MVWGKNDPFFLAAGAEAYRRDLQEAEIVLLDGGHFALEEHADVVAAHITRMFGARSGPAAVNEFYENLGAGNLDGALALLARDVSWNDPKGFPYGGKLTGPAQVKEQVFARIFGDWTSFDIDVDRTIVSADGRSVVALGRYTGTHKTSRKSLDVRFAHAWDTTAGVLTRFETFTDTAALRDATT